MILLLPNFATKWEQSESMNAFGENTFGNPTEFRCRWQDYNQRYIDEKGEERVANSKIYLQEEGLVKIGDRVALGTKNLLLLNSKSNSELTSIATGLGFTLQELKDLLASYQPIAGLDYNSALPYSIPRFTHIVTSVLNIPSLNGRSKLITAITEIYAYRD